MRSIPFAFLDEITIEHINRTARERTERVDALANLAETQRSMRGTMDWPALRNAGKRLVAILENMMEMSGPNSIANLERAIRSQNRARGLAE